MSRNRQQGPPVVAELGRPETPDETAARKAQTSRIHRQSQTTRNLVVALVASLAIVLGIVLVVARPDASHLTAVDYRAVAASAERTLGEPVLLPDLPATWSANRADTRNGTMRDSRVWYLGLLTPTGAYLAVQQAVGEDERWIGDQLGDAAATGVRTIGATEWTVADRRGQRDTGNHEYAMWTATDSGFIMINGTATDGEFDEVAAQLTAQLEETR